jgi:hypothetical protein
MRTIWTITHSSAVRLNKNPINCADGIAPGDGGDRPYQPGEPAVHLRRDTLRPIAGRARWFVRPPDGGAATDLSVLIAPALAIWPGNGVLARAEARCRWRLPHLAFAIVRL